MVKLVSLSLSLSGIYFVIDELDYGLIFIQWPFIVHKMLWAMKITLLR